MNRQNRFVVPSEVPHLPAVRGDLVAKVGIRPGLASKIQRIVIALRCPVGPSCASFSLLFDVSDDVTNTPQRVRNWLPAGRGSDSRRTHVSFGFRATRRAEPRYLFVPSFRTISLYFYLMVRISANPNSGCFNTGQAGKGSKTTLYAGSRDRVASFDYFDVINSAAIQANHGFVTVDAEVYNSADRAVFTVTDPDQNLRTSVVEEPSAIMSNTFVKIGTPYPLGNNPVFKDNFGKQTVNYQPGANTDFNFASTAIGGVDGTNFDRMLNNLVTNQLAPIR